RGCVDRAPRGPRRAPPSRGPWPVLLRPAWRMKEHSYTEDEVREILRRAVERDAAQATHLDRERLIQAAAEIGIDRVTVDHAIEEVERERDVERELLSLRRERKHELISSVGTWGIVNSGLLAIDVATGEGLWFYWPLTIWAMVLLLV